LVATRGGVRSRPLFETIKTKINKMRLSKNYKRPNLESWQWKTDTNNGCKNITAGEQEIAVCFTTGCYEEKQDKVNSRMIAAAPDMACALEEIYNTTRSLKTQYLIRNVLKRAGYKF
jgi:hypothetical protein